MRNQGPTAPTATAPDCPDVPRSTTDRPDITAGPSVHVVYLLGADSPDQQLDTEGTLDCAVEAQNTWLQEQSGRRWNFDMFEYPVVRKSGKTRMVRAVDVTFVRSQKPAAELGSATAIRDELIKLGFAQLDKRYLTYVMASYTTFCGDAIYPVTLHPGERRDGIYAQVYLSATNACHSQDFGVPGAAGWSDAIAQQELMHTEGLTPIGAPHTCPIVMPFAHVCTAGLYYTEQSISLDPERVDLMYPHVLLPLSEKVLDLGHDDYYNHGLPLTDLIDSDYLIGAGAPG